MRRFLLALALCIFLISPSASASVFSDVASNHPHFDAITYLYENDIVEGYADNTFRPDQPVNRAEALKILLLGSDIFVPDVQPQDVFPDVVHDSWYGRYVLKAKNLGIVKGDDTTGLFRPGDTVNLAEALKMLLKTNDIDSSAPSSNPYQDVSKDAWFAPYFEYARVAGLLDQSSGENVHPATPVTRGLLAELMYRLATNDFILADGEASYYGEKFHGRTTASGEIFDASAFTVAHLTYPFGTRLKVTSVETGKSVVVRVNDRGPYVEDPARIIDLSKAAFEYIAPLSRGIIEVKIEITRDPVTTASSSMDDFVDSDILNTSKASCPEADSLKYIETGAFDNITLDDPIPTRMILDDVLTLSGTASGTDTVSAFLVDSDGRQTAFYSDVTNGRFSLSVRFPDTGDFRLGILPGESGTSAIRQIKVLKNTCIEEVQNSNFSPVTGLELDYREGDTLVRWDQGNYNLFKLTFSQGGIHKSYILHDLTRWTPVYREFTDFNVGNVDLSLRGATLTDEALLDPVQIIWSPAAKKTFLASDHYEYLINEDEVELISLTENTIIQNDIEAVFKPKVDIRSKAAVILPNGSVQEIQLASSSATPHENTFGVDVYSAGTASLTARYRPEKTGLHFLEANNAEGLAVLNVPVYIRNQYPLLPSPRDLSSGQPEDLNLEGNLSDLKLQLLSLVNRDRNEHLIGPLKIDDDLNRLAQARSDDMVQSGYFSHWDKEGRTVNDLRANYGILTHIGENLAKDINLPLAEYGLMRSAIHRSNILSEEWARVGFGITQDKDGSYIVVQLFSGEPLDLS